MSTRLLYLAFVRLPTEKAHGLQIIKTCEALARAGAQVTLTIPARKTHTEKTPFEFYSAEPCFAIEVVRTPDYVRYGFFGYLFSALMFSEFAKWKKNFWEADVIYSRDSWVLVQYLLLGRKLVFEAHRKPTNIDRIVARAADSVVVINEALKTQFVASGVESAKIVVAHDAVDPLVTKKTKADFGVPAATPLVVYAGSRRLGKGIETVEAVQKLLEPAITVKIIEGKSPSEAREALAAADVVLVPNSAKYESTAVYTSPMKLFEALQSGARVVVSDVPALREVVDERSVYFSAPDDPQSFAATIRTALNDPDGGQKVVVAQALARSHTWAARADTILNFIER